MAGGNFTTQNKVRPGAYINVASNSMNRVVGATRGIVALPLVLGFGTSEITAVTSQTDFLRTLGYELNAPELLFVREALRGAATVLIGRVGGNHGVAASATSGGFTARARYRGVRGNDITIRIVADIDMAGEFIVETFIDTTLVDSQRASAVADLQANAFIEFSGETLAATAGLSLAGGSDGVTNVSHYTTYLEAMEEHEFNTMAIPTEDTTIKQLAVNFITRMRDEGRKCQVVVADMVADGEYVINTDEAVVTAWVAGVTAGAAVNESNTHRMYDGEIALQLRHVNSDIVSALESGKFVFRKRGDDVIVEQDINSLTTFTPQRNEFFSKNRLLRVMDDIANSVKQMFSEQFIGRVTNDETGRNVFRMAVIDYLSNLQDMRAIENFDAEDIQIAAGNAKDSIVAQLYVQPVDAMEKLYMDVEVV